MALANKRLGAPILASVGRRGLRPDLYDGRIVGQPQIVINPANGRAQEMATIICVQTNMSGEQYLAERLHNLAFAFDRTERVEVLDGPANQPKSWQELVADKAKATLAFIRSRPEAVDEMDLGDIEPELA